MTSTSHPHSAEEEQDWLCWEIGCATMNPARAELCYACGNPRGYKSPELEELIRRSNKQLLERLKQQADLYCKLHDTPASKHMEDVKAVPLAAIKKEMEEL